MTGPNSASRRLDVSPATVPYESTSSRGVIALDAGMPRVEKRSVVSRQAPTTRLAAEPRRRRRRRRHRFATRISTGVNTTINTGTSGHQTRIVSSVPQSLATTSHDGAGVGATAFVVGFSGVDGLGWAMGGAVGGGAAGTFGLALVPSKGTHPTPRRFTSVHAWM